MRQITSNDVTIFLLQHFVEEFVARHQREILAVHNRYGKRFRVERREEVETVAATPAWSYFEIGHFVKNYIRVTRVSILEISNFAYTMVIEREMSQMSRIFEKEHLYHFITNSNSLH